MSGLSLPVHGERFRLESGQSECHVVIVRVADAVRVGQFVLEQDGGTVTVRSVCIDESQRSYGAGSEAARLFVSAAEAGGYRKIRAWAHPKLGLSAYFWGRMGLRPLHGPGPEGGIWYERRQV